MSQQLIGLGGAKYSGKNTAAKVLTSKYGFKEVSLALPLKQLVSKVFNIPFENLEDPILKETSFEQPITLNHIHAYQIHEQCSWMLNLDMFKKTKSTILEGMIFKSVARETKNSFIPRNIIRSLSTSESSPSFIPGQLTFKTFETPRQLLQFVGTELIRECISPYFWCKVLDESIQNEAKVVITDVRFFEERQYVTAKKGTLIRIDRTNNETEKDNHASETNLGADNEYDYLLKNNGTIEELQDRLETLYKYNNMIKNDQIYVINRES
jgi:hypothetical protein